MCRHRGMLNDSMNVDQFFALVSLAERSGAQSQDFKNALGAVEKGIHTMLSERTARAEFKGQVDEEAEVRLEGMLKWLDWDLSAKERRWGGVVGGWVGDRMKEREAMRKE